MIKEQDKCTQPQKTYLFNCFAPLHAAKLRYSLIGGATLMSQMEQEHQTSKQKPNDHVTTLRCEKSRDTRLSIVRVFMNFLRDTVNTYVCYCCLSVHEIRSNVHVQATALITHLSNKLYSQRSSFVVLLLCLIKRDRINNVDVIL